MPPQSAIGVQQSDGTIKAIMLYNDDRRSPAHVILSGWYNSQKKAEELLSLGHLSRLGEKIAPEFGEHHSFDKPQPNTVIAYHRDRGDAVEPYSFIKIWMTLRHDAIMIWQSQAFMFGWMVRGFIVTIGVTISGYDLKLLFWNLRKMSMAKRS